MKNRFRSSILLIAVLFTSTLFAQDWVTMMQDPNVNFHDVQKAFYEYYNKAEQKLEREKRKLTRKPGEPIREGDMEVPGFEQFKRWEHFMESRVSPTGERFDPSIVWREMTKYNEKYGTYAAGNWSLIGPVSSFPSGGGAGRTNFVTVHPTIPTTIWTGSPGGGLWKSTDGGNTWTTNTDQLAQVIGCTDMAIDPTNPNTMYLVTGDGDGGNTYTVGLLKTTDGGNTWKTTGLSFNNFNYKLMNRVLVDPSNSSVILVASTAGLYRSSDAGTTFTMVQSGSFWDIEFKPGASATVYAAGTEYFRSTNNGASWTKITLGLPAATLVSRMAIAVSAADANYVYILAATPTGVTPAAGFQGIYQSTNSGASFTKKNTSPANILGRDPSGGVVTEGGQGNYDLGFAASPTNAQEITVGGINIWKSTDGGSTFTINAYWLGGVAALVHADHHEIEYVNGTTYYSANDGGLAKTTNGGATWSNLSNGLEIGQMYGFGQSATDPNLLLQGWQDNGTNLYKNGTWSQRMGGDGMLAFISHGNDQNQWGSIYYGQMNRSTDGGNSFSPCTSGISEFVGSSGPGPWAIEWNEDPTTANTLYCGFASVWKSTNGGTSWAKLGTVATGTAYVSAIAAAPTTNGQVIYAAKENKLYKTSNGGTTWVAATDLPYGNISDITCHPTDPNKAWVTYGGFTANVKIYQTINQGANWTNISASMPNISVNCVEVDKNGNSALYVGTDAGVFFKDASMTVWQPFSQGLPKVSVTQLGIFYTGNKIRASTYGRGMWESTLYSGSYAPAANFTANNLIGCPGLGVQFTDYSAGQPTSWNWTFQGGNPATSTAQNPFVAYNTPGTYAVSLTSTNVNGTDSKTFTNYITISPSQAAPTAPSYTICGPASVALTATPSAAGTVRWWNQPAGGSVLHTGNVYTTPALSGSQTFYADEAFSAGGIDFVGATDNLMGLGDIFSANDIRGLYFDVFKPVVINKVDVYSKTAGLRTIEIQDANGNTVTDTTLNVAASGTVTPTTVTINRTVYPGKNYFIKFRGLVDCYRNSAGSPLPTNTYDDGGSNAVKITDTNAGSPGYYYFFYNWQFTNIVCNTGRTAVVVTDNCATGVKDLFANNHLDIFPNPNNGTFMLSFNTEKADNYIVKITNTMGQIVYQEKLNDFNGTYTNKIDISSFSKGVYMLAVSNSGNETVKRVLVY